MYKKALIVDDIDLNDIAAVKVLEELEIRDIHYAKYCDDALLKIKRALFDDVPFDLLITDLSFKKVDHKEEKLKCGEELIDAIKKITPEIKIIVFSIEDKPYRIQALFLKHHVNGFVIKGRNSMPELKKAIQNVNNGTDKFLAPDLIHILKDKTINEIDNYDIELIRWLSLGVKQESMDVKFKELGIVPNSKSTIEKRIIKLKNYFEASNTIHLISIAKDMGII
ncbi:DNA-binding NarL/FixJ family response regulator [Flavobacterium endophyticum]|uniref:DNA-binding NarL/FixJ family response regulator n=1 Tax=Flavobacterium endophyticum TaxID=1540163 RepID=A0A495MAZ9_9FLAO|nr:MULTISPECIES: response regulator [Flavobacterium]RKS23166.1 DNA-binding NarL/FixJ family response regulator [Flavobacterium endophyticum]WDO11876.1 response regulator [Flavobacterium sp. WW92]